MPELIIFVGDAATGKSTEWYNKYQGRKDWVRVSRLGDAETLLSNGYNVVVDPDGAPYGMLHVTTKQFKVKEPNG
jgi:hypothetical protein